MSGYSGYSMSNNAVIAYASGERPRSRWTREDMLSEISEQMTGGEDYTLQDVQRLTVHEMRLLFLEWSSWHHTSNKFNRTDFYRVNVPPVNRDAINRIISIRTAPTKKKAPPCQKCLIRFGQWEGTRAHPRLKWTESYAVIRDPWVFLPSGQRLKTDRKHLSIIATYARAPRGTADVFKQIEKHMRKGER